MNESDIGLKRAQARAEALRSAVAADELVIAEAKNRIREHATELRSVERFIENWHSLAHGGSTAKRAKNPNRRDVADKALEIIRRLGRAVSRKELLGLLAEAGIIITGKDPEMVLGTMLYRDDRIVRLRGHGYWPSDEIHEAAFYLPEHEGVIGATEQD